MEGKIPGITEESWSKAKQLFGFSATFLAARYDKPKPIPYLHMEMWALCLSEADQVALAAPRGFAKSTAITFAYVLFILLFRFNRHILLLGSNESLANAFLADIRAELADNDDLREAFGVSRFLKDKESELIVELKDGHTFRIICKGANQRMRGLKWQRKRPDAVVFDDMEDEDLVLSEARRFKFMSWFLGAVTPILGSGGIIRGVGTIIGYDSFLEGCMPPEKAEETVHLPLKTYSKNLNRSWLAVKYRAHNEDFSNLLWEEHRPKDWLVRERNKYAERGRVDLYGQEYLNDPIDESTAYYRKADFLPMTEEMKKLRMTYYVSTDMAISEKKTSAYTVVMTGGLTENGDLCIVDVRRQRIDGLEICEELFSVDTRYSPQLIQVEEENIARSLGAFLYQMMEERQQYLPLNTAVPSKDKSLRSRSMQARARAGKVYVDMEAEWSADFLEEVLRYPKHAYKDQFDALGWLGLMLDEMVEPQTDYELEEDEYNETVELHADHGQDVYTGY